MGRFDSPAARSGAFFPIALAGLRLGGVCNVPYLKCCHYPTAFFGFDKIIFFNK